MTLVLRALQYATTAGFVLLAAITVRDWLRSRERSRGLLALAIGLLGFAALVSQVGALLGPLISLLATELTVVAFMASGYSLLLFRDSLTPLSFKVKALVGAIAAATTLALCVSILLPNATWLALAVAILWIAVWIGAVGEPVVHFWLVSRDRPVVQRARLRALSGGFGGIIVVLFALLGAGLANSSPVYQIGIEALSLGVIPFLYVAFAPPRWLRRVWRASEEEAFGLALRDLLLSSPDRETLAQRSLDWGMRLVGADSGLLVDAGGELLATEGLDESARTRLVAEIARGTLGTINLAYPGGTVAITAPVQTEYGIGGLAVASGPFTPIFGTDEVSRLQRYSAAFMAGLDRVRLVESLRASDESVRQLNRDLEQRVRDRTTQLEASNRELEAFSYTVSHDLRAPLRAITGFSQILLDHHREGLDSDGQHYVDLVSSNAVDMGKLIDALLSFSRLTRQEMKTEMVDTAVIARRAFERLRADINGRQVDCEIKDLPPARSDAVLLEQVYANLLGNAVKFTRERSPARIEVGFTRDRETPAYYVRDNGAGFDMQYADKMFGVFQRLHSQTEYEGTGAGLAIVQRIVHRHGGEIWAESEIGKGATFFFTLGPKG
jgi:signal transduction histidine kinase